ncbi:AAA family ATPase [Micromonospora sp. NPDC002296]|uniref:AAA family ATPase n=1 Tax=Micromonospora sp. NPDC002296 TaxID=3154271 RepID=UPI00331DD9E3
MIPKTGVKWYQKRHVLDILEMETEAEALAALDALDGMDVWRLLRALDQPVDPRDFRYDRWRKEAAQALRKRHAERAKLRTFIATHDKALGLTARPGGGFNFTCPECDGPAAAFLSKGGSFYVTHTLKSGALYGWENYSGSCPLTGRYGPDINVSMLPTNPPPRVATAPAVPAGALSLDEEDEEGDQDWLVDGIVARGDYVSLFGPSGVGKSLLMLDWSLRMVRRGARVLYLDKENPKRAIRARLKAMGATPEDMSRLAVMPFVDLPDLATPAGAQALADMSHQHCADVVVLDTISKFSQVGQASQTDRWTTMYNISFTPLLAGGTAVIQLDHTGLSNQTRERDSGAKRDNVSVAYGLMPAAKAGTLTLTRVKNRLHYPGDDAITLQRVTEPVLTHTTGNRVDPEILGALRELEKAGVPLAAGRDAAREALKAAGVSIGNNILAAAIRLRKAELED